MPVNWICKLYSKGCNSLKPNLIILNQITLSFVFIIRFTFASASPDNIKQWKFPDGNFLQNLSGHHAIVNTLSINSDGVLVSGGRGRGLSLIIYINLNYYLSLSWQRFDALLGLEERSLFPDVSDSGPAWVPGQWGRNICLDIWH